MSLRVLSLGGGHQSSAVYLLAANGDEGVAPLDCAIFADTGEEPAWVYDQVAALAEYRERTGRGCPILVRWVVDSEGRQVRLGDNLIGGNEGRFAQIPAFVKRLRLWGRNGRNVQGRTKRQCTREFKVEVVEATIRRELLGLKKGEAYKGPRITQVFGLDFDEGDRIFKTQGRLAAGVLSVGGFPLWDFQWRRPDCVAYIDEVLGREWFSSACTFCPLVDNRFRRLVRDRDPVGHRRACEVDRGLRRPGAAASKMLDGELYVHRAMIPLDEVDLDAPDEPGQVPMVFADCEGFCGH